MDIWNEFAVHSRVTLIEVASSKQRHEATRGKPHPPAPSPSFWPVLDAEINKTLALSLRTASFP